jgi:hypothetical protein
MFEWLTTVLNQNVGKKFITQTHVFPGNNYYEGKLQQLWWQQYIDAFIAIV